MHRFSSLRPYTPPTDVLDIFRRELDAAWEDGGIFQLTMHPHIIGYRSRIWIVEELIRHAKSKGKVWFATHAEVAALRQGACGVSKTLSAIVTGGRARHRPRLRARAGGARLRHRPGRPARAGDGAHARARSRRARPQGADSTRPTSPSSRARTRSRTTSPRQWGRIDFLLNDAGASNAKGILEIKEEEFDRTIAVNLKSCFNYIHAIAPIMLKQEGWRAHRQHVVAQRAARAASPRRSASTPMPRPRPASSASPGRWPRNSAPRS